jgi:Ca-activated chloride channel family protein
MKFVLVIFLIINPLSDLDKIAKINKAKKEAEQAYLAADYSLANAKYLYLKDSLGVTDDKLLLNLANTQFILADTTSALSSYSELKDSPNKEISSLAYQQLGAMQFNSKKYKEALGQYKSALKENPGNTDARYNYELLKKLIKEQEEQDQKKDDKNKDEQNKDQKDQEKKDQEKQDQQNKDQQEKQDQEEQQEEQEKQDQEKQDEEQEKKDQEEQKPDEQKEEEEQESKPKPIDEEKLKEMKISEEKAKLILEAMKNNEVQYIQQNKRKAKKKKDPTKPDW